MKEGLFSVDGKVYTFLSKVVDVGFLSLLWLVGCLPVVTIVTSTASLYHNIVKCVRYEQGNVWEEFWSFYKSNLRQGIALTGFYSLLGGVIAILDYYVFFCTTGTSSLQFAIAVLMLMVSFVYLLNVLWIPAVFSRFANTFGNMLKLNYVVSLRHLLRAVPMILVLVVAVILFLGVNECFIILPGLVALIHSYMVEPVLWKYMPEQEEETEDWRYGTA